jgi:hypothetical protein
MFNPCAHKVDFYKQSELDPSPLNSNKLSMWTNPLLQCIIHIPKQTQINQRKFWTSIRVEFQGHLLTTYTTK